jgi:7,8-dihydropterin-6-yl-methyl-4-(beta-D-ribofuranosyl)aminobenzene 5'-phosphate synthase
MKLTIVYDNEIFKKGFRLKSDWGFSCLIETNDDTILFDTGANGKILLHNMKQLNIHPNNIKKIIISHEHEDHRGGLKSLVSYMKDIEVYQLNQEFPSREMISIIPDIPKKISDGVWTTGRLIGLVDEHSLILRGHKGWYVLTGCSHPGLEKILQIAKQIGNIIGIIGGFHGINNLKILEDLNFICPCHCTAHKKDIKITFPAKYSSCGVGKTINLNE